MFSHIASHTNREGRGWLHDLLPPATDLLGSHFAWTWANGAFVRAIEDEHS
jgi:hypothetical protein